MHYGFSPQPVELNGMSATQWSPDGDKAALKACQVRLVDRPYHVVIFPQTAPILYQRGAWGVTRMNYHIFGTSFSCLGSLQ